MKTKERDAFKKVIKERKGYNETNEGKKKLCQKENCTNGEQRELINLLNICEDELDGLVREQNRIEKRN